MKILMLTPYLPYPLWSGGQTRSFNLLKYLSKKHHITLFSFIRDEKEKENIRYLKEYCENVKVFSKRPPWSLTSLMLSGVTFYPLVVCMYLRSEVNKAISQAVEKENFDLIHAETFYVMPNIPVFNIPIILAEQTIEYLVYRHYTHSVGLWPVKMLMKWDVAKIKFWEKRFWRKSNRVVAMSEADRQMMHHNLPDLKVDLVPNGVDPEFFSQKKVKFKKNGRTVLFVGNFKWLQNREAVMILVKKVWPKIKRTLKDAKLWIVGKYPTADILKLRSFDITVSENINDIRDAYDKSDILLAPIKGPGGTRYKILEAMASGIPVVTTKVGIEGLNAKNEDTVLICEEISELARTTIRVLTDPSLYHKIAFNSRKFVEKNYNWETISNSLDQIYNQAVYEKKV
ncbi:hypothetical protein A2Y99_02325 [Candidatus Gottesmanbacteria bacterium RBG_13_37_7]|uniref:Glycosyltransferase subfamily 4-like N-terminal domain-containing protein n=1 Tax=Candidatus Gottesmanbacteria bacterium RBG_13_37_7 TaxID=1798369 RepID=A0A1F5YHX3_9BACT|nr:MAG: hypothetical protein A2Y99_02325 [Candidatus Gottesmanbacteria bacterium RBG_13_37_7]